MAMHPDIPIWARRGWEVELKSGEIVVEGERDWNSIPKKEIARLSLLFDGRRWDLRGERDYFQKKRGSVPFGSGAIEEFCIEARTIGYYDKEGKKVCYTVDEHTGDFKLEVV